MIDKLSWVAVYPEIVLLLMACLIAMVDLGVKTPRRTLTYGLTLLTLAVVAVMEASYALGGQTFYGFADLIPTRHHVPLAWIAGFDLYPVETLEFKKRILPRAFEENWICLFYHDTETPLCRLAEIDGKLKAIGIDGTQTVSPH